MLNELSKPQWIVIFNFDSILKMKILFSIYLTLGFSFYLFSQGTISGNIRDDSGNPMEGVSISLENASFGVASNGKGDFLIDKIPFGDYTIVISAIGYSTYKEKLRLTEKPLNLRVSLSPESYLLNEIGIVSTRATNETPVAYQSISAEDIKDHNQGQDLPYLLRFTPSLVVNSDAGAGIGYTGMRIRGADITRINVTLNGIPVNDAESHGVFWVNMPDLASSISDLQIQRGVGTSTNGSGAFGASIHLNTNVNSEKAYVSSHQSFGSFNSWKRNLKLGTGNMGNGFSFDARLSKISSDGYIDRAKADLNSFSLFGTWKQKNSVMRLSIIDGSERTYQAWNGVPLSLESDWNTRTFNSAGAERQGSPHPNEIDNYHQTHYQRHYDRLWSSKFTSNISLHYTKGRGYFEQFRSNQNASDYSFSLPKGIDPTTNIDVIRRRWLDNDFYGGIFSVTYKDAKMQSVFGGAVHNYVGQHFGELTWASIAGNTFPDHRYYDNLATKFEANAYWKNNIEILPNVSAWTDFQLRHINYQFEGFNDSGLRIPSVEKLTFFNPKAGLFWEFKPNYNLFLSYAIANREPNRDDYVDNLKSFRPKAENLQDLELGFRALNKSFQWEVNGFYMNYKNLLVQTGRLNDVGAYIRENMPDAYRIGVEWQAGWQINKVLEIKSNLAVSANKIGSYTAFIDDYDENWEWQGQVALPFTGTDIAFSPGIIAAGELKWSLFSHLPFFFENPLDFIWNAKYVSRQYLDNTGNEQNVIPSFFINDAAVRFQLKKNITISGNIFNVLNHRYFSNGWVYSSFLNGELQSDIGVYPQAGRHFFIGFEVGF
jgi:iron complex outermembrane recepter protein